ncbi:unnamed protein product [Caenorhabditis bovis]|uniref:Uncharacterized protein n=1 Tax=Caenorhabditis bovis TaxID=2654633 RepID=A0A8S1EZF9_9PELO|nr:unnamed protein product [Caenorhabditis bovis]
MLNGFIAYALLIIVGVLTSASFGMPPPPPPMSASIAVGGIQTHRESRALTPSVKNWCIFYREKCRMMMYRDAIKRGDEFDY